MCDIGRYGFHRYEEIDRVLQPMVRKGDSFESVDWETAIKITVDLIKKNKSKAAGIVSPFHTNESNFLLGQIFKDVLGSLPPITGEEITYPSGFRISADRSPNTRGMNDICEGVVEDLASEIETQGIRTLFILDDGIDRELDDKWKKIIGEMDSVIVLSYAMTDLAKLAHVVLPGHAPLEREGTVTNDKGRIQWLRPSLPVKVESKPDWEILMLVRNALDRKTEHFVEIGEVMKKMGEKFENYAGITFFKVGDQGYSINGKIS